MLQAFFVPRGLYLSTALFLFTLLVSCNTGLEGYLELQREMIPVRNERELAKAVTAASGSVIGIIGNIELTNQFNEIVIGGRTLTITAFEGTATISPTPNPPRPVFKVDGGTLILGDSRSKGTLVLDGKTQSGAALIMVTPSGSDPGVCIMNDGVVLKGNLLSSTAGGVYITNNGSFIMNGGTISGNTTTANGGGVYITGGTFTMNGGTISNNRAGNGGGVYIGGGTFTMDGGTISNNRATGIAPHGNGGGVCISSTVSVDISGGKIYGNTALTGNSWYCASGAYSVTTIFTLIPSGGYFYEDGDIR